MTVSVVRDKKALKQRLLRFFDDTCESRKSLTYFLNEISLTSSTYIFGGVLRDIALFGVKSFRSDVDIVFTGHSAEIERLLSKYQASKNKFGGYRLTIGKWPVDIWEADNSWAFKNGIREFKDINSLLETTITNWDAILFSWNEKELICKDDYFDHINKRYLDVVLNDNPNNIGVIVRVLRTCAAKEVGEISSNISKLLRQGLESYSFEEIKEYEVKSYGEVLISSTLVEYMKNSEEIYSDSIHPIKIQIFNKTKELFS